MAGSGGQFDHTLDDTQRRILRFLSQYPAEDFTAWEVRRGMDEGLSLRSQEIDPQDLTKPGLISIVEVTRALHELELSGMVVAKTIADKRYYAVKP